MDVFSREKRSQVMAAIRSVDTAPEIAVRRALHAMGFRFRLHVAHLPGRPDIVLKRLAVVIQVKGCFWHGHRCLKGRVPGVNRPYWLEKIAGNRARDRRNERRLRSLGWSVKTVWECRVRRSAAADLTKQMGRMLSLGVRARRRVGGRRAAGQGSAARRMTARSCAAGRPAVPRRSRSQSRGASGET